MACPLKICLTPATPARALTLALIFAGIAAPCPGQETDHFVPADKQLDPEWVRALSARGEPDWYSGADLRTIGMPIGGICAGQLYLTGDGRLACFDIFNSNTNTGYGLVNYAVGRAAEVGVVSGDQLVPYRSPRQGCAIRVQGPDGASVRTLDQSGFPAMRFRGEYPIAQVEFAADDFPVTVALEAFSPFIPLCAADSALPATVLCYAVTNRSPAEVEVAIAGWLENAICASCELEFAGTRLNRPASGKGFQALSLSAQESRPEPGAEAPPVLFADFEESGYGAWQAEGEAFGAGPARGTLPGQQPVSGFAGEGLVNSFLGGDDRLEGRLLSPAFVIEEPCISFLIGGGAHQGRTAVNLLIDGRVVRSATGMNREELRPANWSVAEHLGASARIEIVDRAAEGWGHVNVDQIEFRSRPRPTTPGALAEQSDSGTMALALLDGPGEFFAHPALAAGALPGDAFAAPAGAGWSEAPLPQRLIGAVGRRFTLAAGQTARVTFVLAWHMPNLRRGAQVVGQRYAERCADALAVASYVAQNLERRRDETRLWRDTFYDSTLPWWLLDRIGSTFSILASATCQWWRSGRFWAYEGVGCCHGTCGHVWNYAHALARLFPELERSVREMQDFAPGVGLDPASGAIGFRGEGSFWAGDAQGGYILKAFREHLMSADPAFLERLWPGVEKALRFLVEQDGNADGIIEGKQHNTYDIEFYGGNTMVGALYLAALRAAEEMAREIGDEETARSCREIFESGRRLSADLLWNGEYFIQDVDLSLHPEWQYAGGCLADQLLGQGWAHQVGLGYVYPRENVLSALNAIWKYNWTPDVGPQNQAHPPERWFARPGEAGLFTCTWPKGPHLGPSSVRYRDEVWTGIEYQVAGHMAWEGMVEQALAVCRGVHERYHPSRHNPWNEIECGDHYARALASYGVLIGLAGFESHGPRRHIGFAPRITPERFRAPFTAAEGWGTLSQERDSEAQRNRIEVRWGRVPVCTLAFALPPDAVAELASVAVAGDPPLQASVSMESSRVTLVLEREVLLAPGRPLEATFALR
ncbi:MAG: hypothetical protein HY812_14915 [Planctomycetes bacterium]|nr:hypothetical protein [Planctomycetota bacterium]